MLARGPRVPYCVFTAAPTLAESTVAAVRKAIGDEVEMGIEFHAKFNTPAAIRIGLALEEYDPFFIEEPTGSEDLEALTV